MKKIGLLLPAPGPISIGLLRFSKSHAEATEKVSFGNIDDINLMVSTTMTRKSVKIRKGK